MKPADSIANLGLLEPIDLTPDPNLLVVLAHTDMKPIDALCELVDNSIDSFMAAENSGCAVERPVIDIHLPTPTDLKQGRGIIRVRDNGPGMTLGEARDALTAGRSSRNAFDSLGLFGVGLNIAASKFARATRLITATAEAEAAIAVNVDLGFFAKEKTYETQPEMVDKSGRFPGGSGTIIELEQWWPDGHPNRDFPRRLIQYRAKPIREMLGRRYATLLRKNNDGRRYVIRVRGEMCQPFEHCVWGMNRHVERGGERIPAQVRFDRVAHIQQRCGHEKCGELLDENGKCPVDDSHSGVRRVEERIRGWFGVQRFDDLTHFGVDLIRRGRAIRVLEKDAFFRFRDEVGKESVDYPVDGTFGRIVGEVHMDHVPVGFTKQDFNRESPEWGRAMSELRGNSALRAQQPGADKNRSPMMKIYTGYRRVRRIGLPDMYMGRMGVGKDGEPKAIRIDRKIESEFLERFGRGEPGYYDDAKWWEKVEEASQVVDMFDECPECGMQVPSSAEECVDCGRILRGKPCVGCGEAIPASALDCPQCGKSQVPEGPWECRVCHQRNSPEEGACRSCGSEKGAVNPFSPEALAENSAEDKDLSVSDLQVKQADNTDSQPIKLAVRTADLRARGGLHFPAIVHSDNASRTLSVFIDRAHPVFGALQMRPEHLVAMEAASRIFAEGMGMSGMPGHTMSNLQAKILQKYWGDALSDDSEEMGRDIHSLLDDIRDKMSAVLADAAEDIFSDLSGAEIHGMIDNMREAGKDISKLNEMKKSGAFMLHIPPSAVVSAFKQHTGHFFGGKIWDEVWEIPGIPQDSVESAQRRVRETYLNCLEDCVGFLRHRDPPRLTVRRARLSHEFLMRKMVP